ncbi:hypothetical protein FN846DRAFT_909518 [Sphaerosporella brunnea]|uniref:Uncharacterized protein n=1 Tax=Sphaerosporella brunnea TaxID=1250544 RepID=A0A5J5EQX0_9PEZI|nr:hypothetical protein FN846DRAFT_909518 [Sphaerosporella brunnea]
MPSFRRNKGRGKTASQEMEAAAKAELVRNAPWNKRHRRIASDTSATSEPATSSNAPRPRPPLRSATAAALGPANPRRFGTGSTPQKPMSELIDDLLLAEHQLDTGSIPYSLKLYSTALQTPQIHFNQGQIHLFLCAPSLAKPHFERSVVLDEFFCVGWLMLGVVAFNAGDWSMAKTCWEKALRCFRGRKTVAYEQLGLAYTVVYEEVLWNRAAAERALVVGSAAGVRPAGAPMGAIFRVPGRWARLRGKKVGEGTDWGFRGEGRIVGLCESIYEVRR